MLSAEEARKITGDSKNDYLSKIEEGIRRNAGLGKYEYSQLVNADSNIVGAIVAQLKSLGYNVKHRSQRVGYGEWRTNLEITW